MYIHTLHYLHVATCSMGMRDMISFCLKQLCHWKYKTTVLCDHLFCAPWMKDRVHKLILDTKLDAYDDDERRRWLATYTINVHDVYACSHYTDRHLYM